MNKGRKQIIKSGLEEDVLHGKKYYCYVANNNRLCKWVKRKMNKRYRQEIKKDTNKELSEIE